MTGSVVARRYARAFFDLAKSSGAAMLEQSGKDMAALAALAASNPELLRLFANPVFSSEEKRRVVAALAERLNLGVEMREFCRLMAEKKRLVLLEKIAVEYQALLDAENGVLRGELISAIPLDAARQDAVRANLAKKAGKALALEFTVDKSLLGGMILKVGDTVMDASLKTQLTLLKDTITRGE